jgi:hypothetical protein
VKLQNWIETLHKKKTRTGLVEGAIVKTEFDGLYDEYDPDFDGMIPKDCFFEDYDEDLLRSIYERQMVMVKKLKKYGQTKHLADRMLLVFDDLVGSGLFSNARGNIFKGFNTRHRHYSCSMLMVSQAVSFIPNLQYKEIPKTVRTNYTCLVFFEICNEKELEVIHDEYPMGCINKDKWLQMYNYATKDPYCFMYYNMQPKDRKKRIMKNFDEYIFMGDDTDQEVVKMEDV